MRENLCFQRDEPRELRERIYKVAGLVCLLFFFFLFVRLWHLQIFKGEEFIRLATDNRIRLFILNPLRGKVFDREGRLLAENRPSFNLTVVPEDVKDWNDLEMGLTNLIDIKPEEIKKRIARRKERGRYPFQPVVLKRDLSWDEVARVEAFKLDLTGVSLDVEPLRYYMHNEYISPVIGYIGEIDKGILKEVKDGEYRAGDLIGKTGIEGAWEERLRGTRGGLQVEVDAVGRIRQILHEVRPVSGSDLYLTLDLDLQKAAQEAIGDKVGSVIAMDPNTGEILAMVSSPSYDPNIFAGGITSEDWQRLVKHPFRLMENKAIQGQYPPASTFKIVTAAAALEEGVIKKNQKLFSGGSFALGNRVFRDWREEGHGWIDLRQAIVESADTFFYQLGLELGVDRIARYAKGFGFGVKTGIGLKWENRGLVPTSSWKRGFLNDPWYEGETIILAVGQGYLLATPMQVLGAYSAIANGGKLLIPQIVKEVVNNKGETIYRTDVKTKGRLPVSSNTIDILKNALWGVVNDNKGTGGNARIKGFDVAGKTGTAQVARVEERDREGDNKDKPYRLRDHSWFVGFAPYQNPEIAVVVLVEHGGFGAATAAPIAREVMEAYFMKRQNKNSVASISIAPGY